MIDGQILTQLVLIQLDDATREAIPMEKIVAFEQPKPVMSDGRTMQTPNDRPPPSFFAAGGPGAAPGADIRRPGGVPPAARQERPRPLWCQPMGRRVIRVHCLGRRVVI